MGGVICVGNINEAVNVCSQILCQNSQILKSRRFGSFTHHLTDSRICERSVLKKISAKKSVEKNHPFFDVAKRSTFPQPPDTITDLSVHRYYHSTLELISMYLHVTVGN